MVDDVNDQKKPNQRLYLIVVKVGGGFFPRFAEDDPVTPIASFSDSASPLKWPLVVPTFSRWWFETFFIYTRIPGEMIQFDGSHIFQMG